MGTLINQNLTFDGGVSTADQYSIAFTNLGTRASVGFIFDVDMDSTSTGPFGITLQLNPDPAQGDTLLDWNDWATTTTQILDSQTSTFLTQTDGSIEGGETRTGIITDIGYSIYLLEFAPLAGASYRLRFQIAAGTVATLNYLLTLP